MKRGAVSTKIWMVVVALIVLCAVGGMVYLRVSAGSKGGVARVYQDGVLIREIDLSAVAQSYSFEVTSAEGGVNMVGVRPGGICVLAADCSDNTCVHQGWLEGGLTPIVCLPHKLVIRIEPQEEALFDAVAG